MDPIILGGLLSAAVYQVGVLVLGIAISCPLASLAVVVSAGAGVLCYMAQMHELKVPAIICWVVSNGAAVLGAVLLALAFLGWHI